ncbi:[Fe-Fe] hydrogenase large subunit C-terminal domain-containing protein [Orenia marismortui]|uniref:Iron only hydrogenase large subunit-like protein n=1 Tax=Orenia marismortui TaxID=46469 RepID=A0A4V3GYF8_9FIRM|nr:[Fe-Fe] hydrogenase large subunit C-terminal domain-containing protein [Orenia marismortui]TDX52494.1 iron only hydrogenase large subunit-like protein [Orenia marismortui]
MEEQFTEFQSKRMEIFREIVKREWNNKLLKSEDLDQLVEYIKDKYGYSDEEDSFIKDHIRVVMGLDPSRDRPFSDELEKIKEISHVDKPIVTKIEGRCESCGKEIENRECYEACKYEAQMYKRREGPLIVNDKCLNCGTCVSSCSFGAIADKIEFMPIINYLKDEKTPIYAAVAPSIVGQFGDHISLGQIRTALKYMGFKDMVEVALFADMLTIKEAFEFDELVTSEKDFFLTSCCCPVWIRLVESKYPEVFEHLSPSVSPMVLSGRMLKKLYPEAKVVFIGPCIAKKSEAKEPELKEAIDFVLTYSELDEIFKALEIDIKDLPADEKDQASFAGRIYGRTGGVSFSVKTVVNRIAPKRLIKLKAKKVDGVKDCKDILDKLNSKEDIDANFVEGMGCDGGCVGGPRTNIDKEKATMIINESAEDSLIMTPFDNMNVLKTLQELGLENIEDLMGDNEIADLLIREK